MSLIHIEPNRMGHLTLSFVNDRLQRRITKRVVANGGPDEDTAYVQVDTDIEALKESLSAEARRDLDAGWDVRVRIDGWEAAHFFGYDAHTIFESHAREVA